MLQEKVWPKDSDRSIRSAGAAIQDVFLTLAMVSLLLASASAQRLGSDAPLTTPSARFAYLFENSDIVGYTVNPATSQLRAIQRVPLKGVATDFSATIHPNNKFLYVPSGAAIGSPITGFSVAPTGLLKALKGSPFASTTGAAGLAITSNGKFAFGGGTFYGSTQVEAFSINTTTGALTSLATYPSGNPPCGQAITPNNSFLYVPNYNAPGTIYGYGVNATTGSLTALPGSPFAAQPYNCGILVHPAGKFLFVVDSGTGSGAQISVYGVDSNTGALNEIPGSPYPAFGAAYSDQLTTDPTGQFLYAAIGPSNNGGPPGIIVVYSINQTTGALTPAPGSPYKIGYDATTVVVDPSGKYLYSTDTNTNGQTAYVFSINSSNGALTLLSQEGIDGASGNTLALLNGTKAVKYTPKFAYVTNSGDKSISEFTINDTTGALTAVAGSPVSDINIPAAIAATPNGKWVFTGNVNGTISEYLVNATTGALTLGASSPLKGLGNPVSLAVDPSSKYLLVADQSNNKLSSYTISGTGALKLKKSVTLADAPNVLSLDPAGQRVVVGAGTETVYYVPFNADGTFGSAISYSLGHPFVASTVDPSSQYIFQVDATNNALSVCTLLFTGLTGCVPSSGTGNTPSAVLVEPSDKYLYAANRADSTISAYSLNNLNGILTPIAGTFSTGLGPDWLAASNDGKFLYSVNQAAATVSIFTINSDGTLAATGIANIGTGASAMATTGIYK